MLVLYVDVPVSWDNFSNNAVESGLEYNTILAYVDKIVIWNYFYLKGKDPVISRDLAKYLTKNFNSENIIVSILYHTSSGYDCSC